MTYQGQLVERKLEFQADKVIGVGISVAANSSSVGSDGGSVVDSSSSSSSSTGSQHDAAAVESSAGQQAQQQQPSGAKTAKVDVFKIYIKSIRAEGEM